MAMPKSSKQMKKVRECIRQQINSPEIEVTLRKEPVLHILHTLVRGQD